MTRSAALLLTACALTAGGCASLTNPVADGVPVNRLPAEVLGRSRSELRSVPETLLRQPTPAQYLLDRGDVLAVVAEDVLGPANQAPPVASTTLTLREQSQGTTDPPAVGYPVPVRDDGTISLPRLPPLDVRGRTIKDVESLIQEAITGRLPGFPELVKPAAARVTVQLLHRRRYQVLVVREDSQQNTTTTSQSLNTLVLGTNRKGAGYNLSLPAYENDVLRALNASGGPPGLDAKNEVIILRSRTFCDPAAQVVRIPLRAYPDKPPTIREEDIILHDGDVLKIEARDTEVFYTAGIIGGAQYPLPRDYDLDVIQAVAAARGPLINGSFSQNAFVATAVNSGIGFPNPSLCVVVRTLPDGRQFRIRVDLNKAFRDPRERIIIKPSDVIVLQERPGEATLRYLTQSIRFNTVVESIQSRNIQQTIVGNNP